MEQNQTEASAKEELARLRGTIEWILNDAAYKAPEQMGEVAYRWVGVLQSALKGD